MARAVLEFKDGETHEFSTSKELMELAFSLTLLIKEAGDYEGRDKDTDLAVALTEAAVNMKKAEIIEDMLGGEVLADSHVLEK